MGRESIGAGELTRRVTLQKPDPASPVSAKGQRQTAYLDVATVYARIRTLSQREKFIAGQQQAASTHEIAIRHSSTIASIDGSWRVAYGERVFTVDGLPNIVDEARATVLLLCTESARKK